MDSKASMHASDLVLLDSTPDLGKREIVFRFVKRCFDILVSLLGIIVLVPVFVITAIAVLSEDGGAVIYTQERIGKNCRPFKMYKFRSMKNDAEKIHEELRKEYGNTEVSFKLRDDPRITAVGKIIRAFNIDELPQLFNILKGDMSFVGPRPLPVYEYEEEQRRYGNTYIQRYSVPQGLTCYWQISDRAKQSFEMRMQLDVEYARKCSLAEDMRLFVKTFLYTITGKAAY